MLLAQQLLFPKILLHVFVALRPYYELWEVKKKQTNTIFNMFSYQIGHTNASSKILINVCWELH